MDTDNCQDELQPIAECFIKQEIDYESTSPELQDDEVDRGEEVNPLLYPNIETQTCAHAKQEEDTVKHSSSSIENEFLAQPGSSVWSSNDVSPIDTEVDELIVPDLIIHKRKSTSKGREGIGEETSIGVDPLSIVVSTSNINSKSKRCKYDRKMKMIDPSDTNKPSSDFDPSLVVVADLQINTSPNVGDSSTVVPVSGGAVLDDPLTIAVDPHDYKSKDDPSPIVTDNSNLEENSSPDQPSPVQSSDSKPSPDQSSDSDSSQGNSGTNYYPQLPINPNPKVTLLKCFFCKFSCFNATNFATHLSTHEQLLKCSHCNYKTVKRHLLKKHTQTHFGKRFFDCDECEFKTSITENLVGHMRTKHAKKERYNCKHCDAIFSTVGNFADHLSCHKGNILLTCRACDLVFTNQTFLNKHKTLIHSNSGELSFSCRVCNEKFADLKLLKDHESTNHKGNSLTEEQSLSCCVCEEQFTSRKLLMVHNRMFHEKDESRPTGIQTFTCSVCYLVFTNQRLLKEHERVEGHEKNIDSSENFACSFCGDYFPSEKLLRSHHRVKHKKEKFFQCIFCDYKCSESTRLTIHLRCHTGEKPYECEHCDYRCADSNRLRVHLRMHTGERPYQCIECHARFSSSNVLKSHMRTHTLEKPFKCRFCEFRSARSTNLRNHVRSKHEQSV